MSLAADYSLSRLLETAGAKIRGRRADCPRCGGRRTVSYTQDVFHCHHSGCSFEGNTRTLSRELGLAPKLMPAEARLLRAKRERAQETARALLVQVRAARFGLDALHIELLNLRDETTERLKVNDDDENAWETLTYVLTELPRVRAELALLAEGTFGDRMVWLKADADKRREMVDRILMVQGIPAYDVDPEGNRRWVEVVA